MKKTMNHHIIGGILLLLSIGVFAQTNEEAWNNTPSDGPLLANFERIVYSPDTSETEQYAAAEFQKIFEAFTGKTLTIDNATSNFKKAILIGTNTARIYGQKVDSEKLGEEGFKIDISSKTLAIYGANPRGTLYGVYEFFEKYCGVRFLTHDHTYYPKEGKDKAFKIKGSDYSHVPLFAFRWSYYGETNRNPAFAARLRTNTVKGEDKPGGITGYKLTRHNVAKLVPPSIYGKEHPEYYALVNGKRVLEVHGGGPQLCMTNKEVLEIVIKATLDAIEKNPTIKNFSVAQMDNGSYCTCESCATIDAREETHAGATLHFVNAVAERIEKTHPEVMIGTFAYQYTRKPPKTISARDNVLIQLCSIECCDLHAINNPSCTLNQDFCEDMDGWKAKASNLFIWHYNTNFRGYLLPFPNLRSIGESVDYFANNNGKGVFMQAAGNGFSTELSDLRNYVISRCLWKPGRDSWQEALNFCRMHYKEAAQPIIDYLTYYHNLIEEKKKHPLLYATEASLYLNTETVKQIDNYFKKALALAKSDEVRTRVEKASLCVYRAKLSVSTMNLKYENGICKPSLDGVDENLLEDYTNLCAKYKVIRDNEYVKNDIYLNSMNKIYSGMTAVLLENEFWQVMILPESNAKVVEMTYKPTGRNVIQPSRSLDRFRFEEWSRQGDGPKADGILPYDIIEQSPTKITIALTAKDGSRIERSINLEDDFIHFETSLKANESRPFNFFVHPEYNAGSDSNNPDEVGIYVKSKEWIHANQGWVNAKPTSGQSSIIREGLKGGSFAYFNQNAGFGVEQQFEPNSFENIMLYWSPERIQINLEMIPTVKQLQAGQEASYSYDIHYLDSAPLGK